MKRLKIKQKQERRAIPSMLLRVFALVAFLATGVSGAWAAEYTTSVNLSFLNNSFVGNGEKQWANNEGLQNAKISWSNIANETMEVGGNRYYKFTDDNAYIKIAPYYSGVSAVFMPGDIVTVRMSTTANDVDGGFCIKSSGHAADGWQKISPNVDYAKSYTLKAEDINDDGSITIYRLAWGSNLKYYSFEVKSYRYTVNIDLSKFSTGLPSGCDAWFTINDGATQYRTEQTVSAGTKVTYTMSSTNPDYTPAGWRTSPWADPDLGWMGWSSSFTTTIRNQAVENPANNTERLSGNINAQPEFNYKQAFRVTAGWGVTIPDHAKGWGLPTFTVKVGDATVDASNYTLRYDVVDGPITVSNGCVNVNEDYKGDVVGHIKVTAVPNDPAAYAEGSVTIDVNIQHTARVKVTVTPQEARIGEKISIGVQRETGFTDPRYVWTFSDGASNYLYGVTGTIDNNAGENDRDLTFVAKKATTTPVNIHLKFTSTAGYVKDHPDSEQADAQIKVKPIAVPTVKEDIDGVHFTYEQDYDGVNGSRVDAFLEYFTGEPKADNSNRVQVGFGDMESVYTATNIPQGSTIYVKSVIHYKDADGGDHYEASETIKFVTDDAAEFPTLDLMKQPRWANGIAKRYIPIGVINELKDETLTPLTSEWPEGVTFGKGAITNNTMGYFLGGNEYPIEREGRGVCISRNGKANWAWTSNDEATRQWLPKSAAFVMDVAGTLDVVLFAENTFHNSENTTDGNEGNRRLIKVWYLNNQCKDGKPIELESWGIVGKRYEGGYANGGNGAELRLHVRLPQLGTDGKTTLLFTYEGDGWGHEANDTDHDLWIRGFLIQRPDLRISIGRTDNKYPDGDDLIKQTVLTENTPYIWSFEPNPNNWKGDFAHKDKKDAVGFRPASDIEVKKNNVNDGRIYVCGAKCDHLLIYSDNYDVDPDNPITPLPENERPELDGRDSRNGNSHIELVRPTIMAGNNGNDNQFNPIRSNGIKVNVTGSGWFKIKAAAPNGPVRMKVLTSTNGGVSKIRVLKEFIVPKTSETGWNEYTAYLKAQISYTETYDEDEETGDIEKQYMSLYVVFEGIEGETYSGLDNYPQLNINQLSWLNELPVIYNFQREENPKLLTTLRKSDMKSADPDFYWQMGTHLKENGVDTYDRIHQTTKANGQESTWGNPSNSNGNGGKSKGYVWDIAAPASTNAHTEAAYAAGHHDFDTDHEFKSGTANGLLEFGSPISGSFLRICSMKNNYIVAHFVQSRETAGTTPTVYVLDELGKLIPYCPGADTFNADNLAKLTPEAKMHGCVSEIVGLTTTGNGVYTVDNGEAFRIDFIAPAGKEFFICANNGALSLARLEALNWRVNAVPEMNGSLTLNDNASNNSSAISTAMSGTGRYAKSVTLNRSFTNGKWASLVLPFSMNEVKFKQVFGDDATCIHFTDVDKPNSTVKLTHHFYDMIVAGRPVFVRPSKAVDQVITDVTLQAAEVINTTPFSNDFVFTASYDGTTINPNDLYLSNNNAILYYTGAATTYPGMRSFVKNIKASDYDFTKTETSQVKAMFLNFDDEEVFTTGIDELISGEFGKDVIVVTKSTKVYDLNGRIVAEGADINTLPAGIYIVNGKKYIVK